MGIVNPLLGTAGGPRGDGEAAERNALAVLLAEFNGNVDASNVKDGSLTINELGGALQQLLHSPGDVKFSARATPEAGWLVADGSAVSRSTYAALFSAIGTQFGTGDGSTTFNLPDLRGRVPVGKGQLGNIGTLGGSDNVAVASRSPVHTHRVQGDTAIPNAGQSFNTSTGDVPSANTDIHTHGVDVTSGIGGPTYLVLNPFIKY
jgi:microcystin-dependent protein